MEAKDSALGWLSFILTACNADGVSWNMLDLTMLDRASLSDLGAPRSACRNPYWPTLYLIDKRGRIRYIHVGEGAFAETERNIQALLAETYP